MIFNATIYFQISAGLVQNAGLNPGEAGFPNNLEAPENSDSGVGSIDSPKRTSPTSPADDTNSPSPAQPPISGERPLSRMNNSIVQDSGAESLFNDSNNKTNTCHVVYGENINIILYNGDSSYFY